MKIDESLAYWALDGRFPDKGNKNDPAGTAMGLLPFLGAGKTHKVSKFYQAVVAGYYDRKSSTLTAELDGERAISHITRIMATKDASFLKIRIETGRTHQIRRHLSMLHFPVLGDSEYGMKKARDPRMLTLPRHMLHACSLELQDPLNPHEEIKAHSPLPADFRRCLQLFGMGR